MKDLRRMWVNQPSNLQPLHKLHGTNVLACTEYNAIMKMYFLNGPIISQQCDVSCLSEGWK